MKVIGNPGLIFLAIGMAVLAGVLFLPPVHQDPSYHSFADQRELWGVPNFWNVVSNLPFLLVGFLGIWLVQDKTTASLSFIVPTERWPFLILFAGVGLTAFGSAYYHWQPTNDRLVWDRLPMAVSFM